MKDPAEKRLEELVRRYGRRFTPDLFKQFLLGRHSRPILQGRYHRSPGFGCFEHRDPDDVKEMIYGLLSSGKIQIKEKGGWKGKITT